MNHIKYISAGAGSGKTTKIVEELVDFISKGNVKPSEVIMTTYTIAAAQEMRERARNGLLRADLPQQASELDAAAIGTVHAVCLAMIQKYWYLLGLSPDLRQLEDNDLKIYTDQSINELVDEGTIQWFEKTRRELGITHFEEGIRVDYVAYWRDALKTIVEKARYYEVEDLEMSRSESLAEIDRVFSQQPNMDFIRKEVVKWDNYLSNCSGRSADKAKEQLRVLRGAMSKSSPKSVAALIKLLGSPAGGKSAPDASDLTNELNQWVMSSLTSDPLKAIVNKLFDLAIIWHSRYVEYKRQHRLLDFNDMELYFYKLITEHPEAIDDIHAHYRLLMVDEFQDCNPVQLRIFRRLSEIIADQSPLPYSTIWVGDPKQAIYGFRGSDTGLVQRATASLTNRQPLEYSWRSRPALVEWTNKLFLQVFEKIGLSSNEITLKFPHEQKKDPLPIDTPAVVRWKTPHKGHEYYLAQGVLKLHETFQWKDIAILLRTNAKIDQVVDAMRSRGIPVSAPETEILPRAEVQLLIALLEYAQVPKYRNHLKADILHLIKDQTTEELLNDYLNFFVNAEGEAQYQWKKEDELIAQIEQTAFAVAKRSYYAQLTAFVDSLRLYDLVCKWGEAEVRKQNIISVLTIAQKYDNHLEQMQKESDFASFMQYLTDSDIHPTQTPDFDAVRVMTYHRAKGLEWPAVILQDLERDELNSLIEHEYLGVREVRHSDDTYHIRYFPPLATTAEMEAEMKKQRYYSESEQRVLQEIARLLYVGVTRACNLLVLDTQIPWESQGTAKTGSAWIENVTGMSCEQMEAFLADTGVPEEEIHLPEDFDPTIGSSVDCPLYTLIDTATTRHNAIHTEDGKVLKAHISPSGAHAPKSKPEVKTLQLTTAPFRTDSGEAADEALQIRQSTLGTCVHNIYAAYRTNDSEEAAIAKATDIIAAFGLDEVLNPQAVIGAIRALYDHLTTTYGAANHVAHEVPFSMPTDNGQVVRGEIDLLWYTSEDECVLVDFKNIQSDAPNPEHYLGQMDAYRTALKAAGIKCKAVVLYYASLGTVVTMAE